MSDSLDISIFPVNTWDLYSNPFRSQFWIIIFKKAEYSPVAGKSHTEKVTIYDGQLGLNFVEKCFQVDWNVTN